MRKPDQETPRSREGSGRLRRLLHLPVHEEPAQRHTYRMKDGKTITIRCEGCGAASRVDVERGFAADNPGVGEGYFSRPCPHCGAETVVNAERRPF